MVAVRAAGRSNPGEAPFFSAPGQRFDNIGRLALVGNHYLAMLFDPPLDRAEISS
jgi:hypothetical protein